MVLIAINCSAPDRESPDADHYQNEIEDWRRERLGALMERDSWLSLAGLYWLAEGEQRFGADSANRVVFPEMAPPVIGSFTVRDDVVIMEVAEDIQVLNNGRLVKSDTISAGGPNGMPPVYSWENLSWHYLKRGKKVGIRLKDSQHPAYEQFVPIESYPIDRKWQLPARFIPYEEGKQVVLDNVLGMKLHYQMLGYLAFEVRGEKYRLDALKDQEELFVIFADATTGTTTYGGGRYLYASLPEPGTDRTVIDFNKAYNPPCVFTSHATCLLPPSQNRLDLAVLAGELDYGNGQH